jgi:hypothetical protein
MGDQPLCVDCKARAPETTTNYTLIGSQHGWRVSRKRRPDGTVLVEWRCATCWKAHKVGSKTSDSAGPTVTVDGPPRTAVQRPDRRKTSRPPPRRP